MTDRPAGALLDRRLLVVTGKGGVGKSTVSAALGLMAARAGRRTIVAEVARRDDVAAAFAPAGPRGPARTFEEVQLAPGLFHVSIDPQDALEEYLRDQLSIGALADVLAQSRMFGLLAAATPGLRELLTMGKLWELAQDVRRTPGAAPYDLVIADAPATGHGLAILRAPLTFAEAAHGGPVTRQGHTIHAMLADPTRTGVVAVTRAEELPVSETGTLREALRAEMGLELERVVVNALRPDRFTPAEAAELERCGGGPAVERALRDHHAARRQRAQLARLRRLTGQVPLRLPLQPAGTDLDALADLLGAQA
jgi:anion-transporting  ArsA/GET3 family ATPase